MALEYRTRAGDTVDLIVWRQYGRTDGGIVERVLAANPGLAEHGPRLPGGLRLILPSVAAVQASVEPGVKLWA
ncbi:MAG: tail protein X [Xanthomonadaceae bacterium]|nr:tail protein X [Xanthomonadaceae bacterium]